MATVNDIYGIGPSTQRSGKNEPTKKLNLEKDSGQPGAVSKKNATRDTAQISSEARELLNLKMDAAKYLDEVRQAVTLNDHEINQIKSKIQQKYYMDREIIDKIVDELAALPNYKIKKNQ